MKNKILTIAVSLASMAGVLLVSGVVRAQAEETPIEVQFVNCRTLGSPDRDWVDEDGIRHIRDQMFKCGRIGDMVGTDTGWASGDFGLGHRFERGYYAFTGRILGQMTSGVGRYTEDCDRTDGVWSCTGNDVLHLDGGGLVKFEMTWEGDDPTVYSGVYLDPPAGAKRNRLRSK